jgi:TatA/E family protein of Tat protein translocase
VNFSFSEILVIGVVALLLFGPDKLPEMASQFGKLAAEFRKGSNAVRREFYNSFYQPAAEVRRDLLAQGQDLRKLRAEVLAPPTGSVGTPSSPQAKTQADETDQSPPPASPASEANDA